MSANLFGEPLVAGLDYSREFISEAEEQMLIEHLPAEELSPFRFHRWIGKRLTRTFGWSYDFENGSFAPAEPIPDWLQALSARAASFAGIKPGSFEHALLVRYDPGAGIGWHRDRPQFDSVVAVSLGSSAVLRLRRRKPGGFDRANLEVEPRSAYLLSGEARQQWEHSIAPGDRLRFSITFRTLSELARRAAAAL